jgi:hypothetical protein
MCKQAVLWCGKENHEKYYWSICHHWAKEGEFVKMKGDFSCIPIRV